MEYHNSILCIPANQYYHQYADGLGIGKVVQENCVSYGAYQKQVQREGVRIVRQGKGENNYALIAFDSIPQKYHDRFSDTNGDLDKQWIDSIERDYKALEYFSGYRYDDGTAIVVKKVDNITLWSNNAAILNAIGIKLKKHTIERAKMGKKPLKTRFFKTMGSLVAHKHLQERLSNNLPTNGIRLQKKYYDYIERDYFALIKQYKGNDNKRKINSKLIKLLEFIAAMPTRPYYTKVVEIYEDFMYGNRELVDTKTGVMFDKEDYFDRDGHVIEFTEAAVWHNLSTPAKQAVLDKKRLGSKDYMDMHQPHVHRHSPFFSFSKISLDDRDLIWKDKNTKKRVKAYYAYDVASGCRIGSSYSMDKDEQLFLDCLRDMFVFIERHGFGVPMEVEVENHLVRKFFTDLDIMFPYLTICAPGNSRAKRAEHFNRAVKYQIEKNNHPGVGRWWLKSRYNRIGVDKVDDEFKQKMKDVDRLIVDDIQDTLEFNNSLHPKQKLYPGMTRMQVLLANVNPNLPKLSKHLIYRYIGFETPHTSIRANMYLNVNNAKYILPHPSVLELLAPNNREVQAYWMPNNDGSVAEIYIYQNNQYICTCERLDTFNEAKVERTADDLAIKLKQDKYITTYNKYIKNNLEDFPRLQVSKPLVVEIPEPEVVEDMVSVETETIDYSQKAIDDLLN